MIEKINFDIENYFFTFDKNEKNSVFVRGCYKFGFL